jgi:hypothetical protein
MTRYCWCGAIAGLAAIAAMFALGATSFAAGHRAHSNYRGPARVAPVATAPVRATNYRGPARSSAPTRAIRGTNRPASATNGQG